VLAEGCVIVERTPVHLSACGDLAQATHRVDRYPLELQERVGDFLTPPAQLAAWVAVTQGSAIAAAHRRRLRPVLGVVTTYSSANHLYQRAGWNQIGLVSVAMPSGTMIHEYVYVGPTHLPHDVR
jgi:hypothetical protein